MDRESDNWINAPAFNWTPEVPLTSDSKFDHSLPAEAPKAKLARVEQIEPVTVVQLGSVPDAAPIALFHQRLLVGLGEGVFLTLLFAARAGMDSYVFSAALTATLFAPLLLLSGLGRVRFMPLLVWTVCAAALLAGAGAYHYWRTLNSDSGHPGLSLVAMASLFLFVGQALMESRCGDYAAHYRSAWRLAIRIVLCACIASLAWAAAGTASGWVRANFPALPYEPLIIPMVAVATALAAEMTDDRFLAVLQEALVFVFAIALIPVLLLAMAVAGLSIANVWQPSLGVAAGLAIAVILCINASYRDGAGTRPTWRLCTEFTGSLMLLPLAVIAGTGLAVRVAQHGWTDIRIFAAAGILMLAGYALTYAAAALISLGGGRWMQRIESSNLALAFAGLMLLLALASPIADPARLAVASQSFRLDQHQVTADRFDYVWLRDHGLRFGRNALTRMEAVKGQPEIASGAMVALTALPAGMRPTPTEIGANIHLHSAQGLPAGLLARDWTGVTDAPPCLTNGAFSCDAFFADMDGDGRYEILLAYGSDAHWWASLMRQGQGGGWYVAGTVAPPCPGGLTALRSGQFSLVRPDNAWRELLVDGMRLPVTRPKSVTACPVS